jgi:NitT/TauT family transport system substrate-binding protein
VAAEPFRLIVTDLEAPLVPNSVMDLALELGYFERKAWTSSSSASSRPLGRRGAQAGEGEMANISVDACCSWCCRGPTTCAP